LSDDEVRLEDRDPYDYASATCVFERPARVAFDLLAEQSGHALHVRANAELSITPRSAGEWESHEVEATARVTFRTGPYRGIGGANPVDPATDRPHDPIAFRIRNVRVIS
jgi:hypothetical protein